MAIGLLAVGFLAGFGAARSIEGNRASSSNEQTLPNRLLSYSFYAGPVVFLGSTTIIQSPEAAIFSASYTIGGMIGSLTRRR